jgi:formamidopyrimidine-DNA glycosylase
VANFLQGILVMPELPEVETIRRRLGKKVIGHRIERAVVRLGKIVVHPSPRVFQQAVRSERIQGIARRGKYLLFETPKTIIVVHLGMTGQLTYWDQRRTDDRQFRVHPLTGLQRARQHRVDKHTHVTLYFADGNALHYRDIRQFGKWRLYRKEEFEQSGFLKRLGLEPFTPDYCWSAFQQLLEGRARCMKTLLLDQGFVAGVGNIYADEALFEARIHPERVASSLSRTEKLRLFRAIPLVLERGLENNGTTIQDFIDPDGEEGGNQEFLQVYGRKNENCLRCRTPIQRLVIGQRSSHFCPRCQPAR